MFSANFEGPSLLPHFLEHYSRLGIQTERMLFGVNYYPRAEPATNGTSPLNQIKALLDAWGADYRVWLGQYSAEEHLKFKLQVRMTVYALVGDVVSVTL
jgi:hypothetical protein